MTDTLEIKARILIVDDNEELCDGFKDCLEKNSYAVACAINGKDAIAMSQVNKYDIAIVDIKLPDIKGIELVKKLSTNSSSMEFILITA